MNSAHRQFEIRCPVHGFIGFNDWEREVIAHPAFQRLRRIRQLAWTEFVYPGATHTRFEHSLGVMHLASRIYDALTTRRETRAILEEQLGYDNAGFERDRQLLRFAALLHDVGHGPLSHASEDLMPEEAEGRHFTHEQYSAAIIRTRLNDVIKDHPLSSNYNLRADEIADFIEGKSKARRTIFWRELLDGQIDADRMDYLRRDSYHAGVQYGQFDLERIVATITIAQEADGSVRLGVTEGGFHAAESIVLARYFMFTQVYFHKTRVAYDIILRRLLKRLLPDGVFPGPSGSSLDEYLKWDDWRVLGEVAQGSGGQEGDMLRTRNHFRSIYETPEVADAADMAKKDQIQAALGNLLIAAEPAAKSWYKTGPSDIPVVGRDGSVKPLSHHSGIVAKMKATNQVRLYVRAADVDKANTIRKDIDHGGSR